MASGTELDVPLPEVLAQLHHRFECIHPFIDGNKRTGFAVITSTLYANGIRFDMEPTAAAQLVVDFAAGRVTSDAFRATIREHSSPDPTWAEIERLSDEESPDMSPGF